MAVLKGGKPRPPVQARRTSGFARALMLVVALAIGSASPALVRAEDGSLEYAVKANFLYKFGPFVEWPPKAFGAPDAPFNICLVGHDPFGAALQDAIRGQTVDGHPLAVRRLQTVPVNPPCHVLYVGRVSDQTAPEILRLVRGAPVLTVTDDASGTAGGMVHFVIRQGHVRFGIDAASAQSSGLTLSSKLLGLAVPVPRGGG
jgi:hypothetical protein